MTSCQQDGPGLRPGAGLGGVRLQRRHPGGGRHLRLRGGRQVGAVICCYLLLSTVIYCYLHTIYAAWAGCWACCAAWASPCCCGPACPGLTQSSAAPASWSDHYIYIIYTISTLSTLYLHVQVSLPILIGGVLIARNMILPSFIIICLGMIFLNFNWSVSVDMTMWVIVLEKVPSEGS